MEELMDNNSSIFSSKRLINKLMKIAIFIAIFVLLFLVFQVFLQQNDRDYLVWKSVYYRNNNYDLISFGNSQGFVSLNSKVLTAAGINSLDLGTNAEYFNQTYYNFLEAMVYQNPKVVLIELNSFFYDGIAGYEDRIKYICNGAYPMKMSRNKINYIVTSLPFKDSYLALSPVFSYKWDIENIKSTFDLKSKLAYKDKIYTGFTENKYILPPQEGGDIYQARDYDYDVSEGRVLTITQDNYERLDRIIDICSERNIELVLFRAPVLDPKSYIGMAEVFKTMEDKYDIKIYDYNFRYNEIGLNKLDFYNGGHVNINGANKITFDIINNVLEKELGIDFDYDKLEKSSLINSILYQRINDKKWRYTISHFNPNFSYKFIVEKNGQIIFESDELKNGVFEYEFDESGEYTVSYTVILPDGTVNIDASDNFYGTTNIE